MLRKRYPIINVLFLCLLIMSSCSTVSFKAPKNSDDSIIVLLIENNSARSIKVALKVDNRKKNYRIAPGEQEFLFSRVANQAQLLLPFQSGNPVDITPEPLTTTLFPDKIVVTGTEIQRIPLIPEEKKTASDTLLDYFGFYLWADRVPVNFHPFPPRRYGEGNVPVKLNTSETAEAWVDGVNWGSTPLLITVPKGKHQVIYRNGDKELFRTFINVSGEEEFSHSWNSVNNAETNDTFHVVLGNFNHQNQPEFQYIEPLLNNAVEQSLMENPRLELISYIENGEFNNADEKALSLGAELLLDGFFLVEGSNLVIYSRLKDVQSGQIRSSETFPVELGLDILKAMNEIASEISEGLNKILPEPGEEFYLVVDDFDESLVEVEQVLAVDYTEAERFEKPNAFYAGLTMNVMTPAVVVNGTEIGFFGYTAFNVQAERYWTRNLSTRLTYVYTVPVTSRGEEGYFMNSHKIATSLLYSLSGSEKNEQFCGLGIYYQNNESMNNDLPFSFSSLSPFVIFGTRVYTSDQISGNKRFWDFSFDVPFLTMGFSDYGEVKPNNLINFHMAWGGKF